MTDKKIAMITVDEFHDKYFTKLADHDCLLDVRTEDEYDSGHIPEAINQSHESVMEAIDTVNSHKRVFIYCRRGARAQVAAKELSENHCKAEIFCIYDAGMDYWKSKGWLVS